MTPPTPPDVAADLADDVRNIEHALNRLRPDAHHPVFAPVLRRLIARVRALTEVADAARATLETECDLPEGIDAAVRLRLAVCALDGRDVA